MNYVRSKSGQCEKLPDPLSKFAGKQLSEKEEDCALEGYYYITQGYRKIPGNKCYAGVQLDPIKKACTSIAWLTSMFNSKSILWAVVVAGVLYYGWPIIEAIILVLPIPDPKDQIEKAKNMANQAQGMVQGAMASGMSGGQDSSQYS